MRLSNKFVHQCYVDVASYTVRHEKYSFFVQTILSAVSQTDEDFTL